MYGILCLLPATVKSTSDSGGFASYMAKCFSALLWKTKQISLPASKQYGHVLKNKCGPQIIEAPQDPAIFPERQTSI